MAEAVLELDLTPALGALDDLDAVFDGITGKFAESLSSVVVDAIAPQLDEIQGLFAGVAGNLGNDLNDAFQGIDTGGIENATGSTDDLNETLDTLEQTIGQTRGGIDLTNTAFGGLQAATGVLEGSSRGLITTLLPGAAAFAGVTAAVGALVERADRAELSVRRIQLVFGDAAPTVFDSRIQGLNLTLGDLNKQAGGSNTALRLAVATFGQTATAAGATQEQAAQVAQRMGFLATAVTTLNPALGTADSNFQLLTRGLGGSTRILQRYGITIDSVQQSALALTIAQENGRVKASLYDKQVAGSTLALQALEKQARASGTTLQAQINEGLDSSTVKFRAFKTEISSALVAVGTPLIAPALDIVTRLEPPFVRLIGVLGEFAQHVIPALVPLADALLAIAAPLTIIVDVLNEIPAPVITAVAAFLAFRAILGPIESGVGRLVSSLGNIPGVTRSTAFAVNSAGEAVQVANNRFAGLSQRISGFASTALPIAVAGLTIGTQSMSSFGETTAGTIGTIGGFTAAGAALGSVIPGVGTAIGALAGGVAGLTVGVIAGGASIDDYRAKIAGLGDEIDGLNQKQGLKRFIDELGQSDLFGLAAGNVKSITDEIVALASKSPAAAEKVVAGLKEMRNEGGKPLFNDTSAKALDAALEKGTNQLNKYNERKKESSAVNQELTSTETQNTAAITASTEAQKAATKQIADLVEKGTSALPSLASAFSHTTDTITGLVKAFPTAGDAFKDAAKQAEDLEKTLSPTLLAQHLEDTLRQAQTFSIRLRQIYQAGYTNIAQVLAEQGPAAANELASTLIKAIDKGDGAIVKQMNTMAGDIAAANKVVFEALSPSVFLHQLEDDLASIRDFNTNLETIISSGFGRLAAFLVEKGPEVGGKLAAELATGIRAGQPEVAAAINKTATELASSAAINAAIIRDQIGPAIISAQSTALSGLPEVTRQWLTAAGISITDQGPDSAARALGVAQAAVVGYREGLVILPDDALDAMGQVNTAITSTVPAAAVAGAAVGTSAATGFVGAQGAGAMPDNTNKVLQQVIGLFIDAEGVNPVATQAGYDLGQSFMLGIAAGIREDNTVIAAAQGVIKDAERAAREAADSHSPSRVFAILGRDIAAGLALGLDDGTNSVDRASARLISGLRNDLAARLVIDPAVSSALHRRDTLNRNDQTHQPHVHIDKSVHAPITIEKDVKDAERTASATVRRLRNFVFLG